MRRPRPEPEPVEQIAAAVHAWEEAKRSVEELQAALAEAELRAAEAKALVGRIAAVMASQEPAPEQPHIAAFEAQKSPIWKIKVTKSPYRSLIENPAVSICWRLAFILLEDPVLDYQKTAELFWGSGLDKSVAKNRVNAQMTRLRKLDIVKTLGSNRYEVDRARLAEKSRLQVPEEAP